MIIETGEGGMVLQDGTEGNKIQMKFSGKAKPLGARWMEGFDDGYKNALAGRQINEGPYGDHWSSAGLAPNPQEYGNGYAEGNLSGWSELKYGKRE
jgi:hypothetical protein